MSDAVTWFSAAQQAQDAGASWSDTIHTEGHCIIGHVMAMQQHAPLTRRERVRHKLSDLRFNLWHVGSILRHPLNTEWAEPY